MYRQYENPIALEKELTEAKAYLVDLLDQKADEDTIVSMRLRIEELKETVNFAWQDEEYNQCCGLI